MVRYMNEQVRERMKEKERARERQISTARDKGIKERKKEIK